MSESDQTNVAQAVVRPRTRRRGGQPGNTNAKKAILSLCTLRKRVRDLRRRARAAMALVPLLNLLVPVLGTAAMTHLLHRSGSEISAKIRS